MRQRNGGILYFIKKVMGFVMIILVLLTGVKAIFFWVGKMDWNKVIEWTEGEAGQGFSRIWKYQYPAVTWEEESGDSDVKSSLGSIVYDFFLSFSPLGRYEKDYGEADPAYAGYLKNERFYEEHSFLLYDGGEESGEDGSVNAGALETETGQAAETAEGPAGTERAAGTDGASGASEMAGSADGAGPVLTCSSNAVWPIIGTTYRKEQLADYDFLMKHFYSVHTSTTAGRDLMKADKFLSEKFTLEGGSNKPQILIYHTHSQEEFVGYGPDNPEATVIGIGNYLTQLLTEKGYNVIHDTSVYDLNNGKLDRNKAYTYALDGITGILQKNPSIEVILDVHRDGVNESLHMVNEINGKPTAPIMFFNGVSQTPEGPIEYLPNPYRDQNLAFSFKLQLDSEAYFPNLARKIYIKGLRYNQHLRPRSALIEVGAQTNTYQEALNAMEPLSEILNMVLKES